MNLVSIIIPVYKVEKYLDRCITSVVIQTYKNVEIILVDDGSPDSCPIMCDEWAKKDSRIKVVHKINGGLSSARNAGLDICTGEYIMFLDSDDWYDIDTVELCVMHMLATDKDVGVFGIRCVSDGAIISKTDFGAISEMPYTKMVEQLALDGDAVWNKIFKRYLWDNLRFVDGLIFEDRYAMVNIYAKTREFVCIRNAYYNYYKSNSGSILSKIFTNPRESYFRWKCEAHAIDKLSKVMSLDVFKKISISALQHALKAYIINLSMHCLSEQEKERLCDFINNGESQCLKMKLEYRIYDYSFKHWDIINRIKSLEYLWKYRDR